MASSGEHESGSATLTLKPFACLGASGASDAALMHQICLHGKRWDLRVRLWGCGSLANKPPLMLLNQVCRLSPCIAISPGSVFPLEKRNYT